MTGGARPEWESLKLLLVEGDVRAARQASHKAGLMTQSEIYAAALKTLAPASRVDLIYPADPQSPMPAPAQLEDYDGIIWTGSGLHVYHRCPETDRQIELMQACFQRRTRLFASCWGQQVAAVALGGVVEANKKGREIGIARNIRLTAEGRAHPMYAGKAGAFDAVAIHLDHIVTPPPGLTILASNEACPIQAAEIRQGEAVLWGVQYHPEFSLPYIASLMRTHAHMMIGEGFCRDPADVEQLAEALTLAALDPGRRDLRWRYGLGPDVLDEGIRLAEIGNWLMHLARLKI